jgi:DNA-binding NarL/FixJ family response regulator
MEECIDIIIADDKEIYRKAIKDMLIPFHVHVIAEAENGEILLKILRKKQPHIVLLDLEMPVMDGNQAFERICRNFPEVKVIILSYHFESVLIEDYIERGAKGYIPKDRLEPGFLIKVLTEVKNGKVFTHEKKLPKRKFTPRQKEILPLIFEGLTNDEIAEEVCITKRAVEKQRHKIYQKSGVNKIVDFYKYAFTRGLQFLSGGKKGRNPI